MNTITKKILIDRIAESTGMKRVAVKQVVQEFLDEVIIELGEGNRLEFRDFGVFEVKNRAPRIAQNPKTLERVPVPAKRTVKFKVGRRMREAMDTSDGQSAQATSNQSADARVTNTASQAESKIHVEIGSGVAGTIRSESASAREQETASVR
jgi:integration host factor subunit beta